MASRVDLDVLETAIKADRERGELSEAIETVAQSVKVVGGVLHFNQECGQNTTLRYEAQRADTRVP
jgi:hypothetical protein